MTARARCVREPRGEHGLEGYVHGALYPFEEVRRPTAPRKRLRHYFRVWPTELAEPTLRMPYEVVGPHVFTKYFAIQLDS